MRIVTAIAWRSANFEHIDHMADTNADEVQVVAATNGETTVCWAAVPKDEAAAAVQAILAAGWCATLTNKHLTTDQGSSLKLSPGELRELRGDSNKS